jgi:DNA-binding MarR family transcriptional regulator
LAIRQTGLEGVDTTDEETLARVFVFRMVIRLGQSLRYLMDQRLQPAGLTSQQATLLFIIQSRGSPSLSEAAAAFGVTHQNIKQLASSLERKGFLRIVPDERDARIKRLVTTTQHESFWRERNQADFEAVAEWLKDLSLEEARQLTSLLGRAADSAAAARLGRKRGQGGSEQAAAAGRVAAEVPAGGSPKRAGQRRPAGTRR